MIKGGQYDHSLCGNKGGLLAHYEYIYLLSWGRGKGLPFGASRECVAVRCSNISGGGEKARHFCAVTGVFIIPAGSWVMFCGRHFN